MIVFDTNLVSELMKVRVDPNVLSWARTLKDVVAITSVTLAELLAGVAMMPDGHRKEEKSRAISVVIQKYTRGAVILSFDEFAAKEYAHIQEQRNHHGRPISIADAQIAAICVVHRAMIATRNVKDFEGTGVYILNPWSETIKKRIK